MGQHLLFSVGCFKLIEDSKCFSKPNCFGVSRSIKMEIEEVALDGMENPIIKNNMVIHDWIFQYPIRKVHVYTSIIHTF